MPSPARLAFLLCLLVLGCSRRPSEALPEASPGAARRATPPGDEAEPDAAPAAPADEVKRERDELASADGALKVVIERSAGSGTMHYADLLRIEHGGQAIERRSEVGEGLSRMAPLVDRIVPLSGGRYLLLGWASRGSGQQQDHALLIGTSPGKLALLDELTLSTHRARAALFVRMRGAPAIGVPPDTTDMDDSEDRWSFSTRSGELDSVQFLSLGAAFTSAGVPGVLRYAPPFHQPSQEERKVIWFEVEARQFKLPVVLLDGEKHLEESMAFESFHIPARDLWVDLDDDGRKDVLRCIGDGCQASPCVSYKVYLQRTGGHLFAGEIRGSLSLSDKARVLPQKFAGFHLIESWSDTERLRFERGRYRPFERRECEPEGECSPWRSVGE